MFIDFYRCFYIFIDFLDFHGFSLTFHDFQLYQSFLGEPLAGQVFQAPTTASFGEPPNKLPQGMQGVGLEHTNVTACTRVELAKVPRETYKGALGH